MSYLINDLFYTLQGEGFWTGRPAVFCRFARCNLWTGREEDRHRAVCQFCDTDFLRGEKYELDDLIAHVTNWDCDFIVLTGGEPSLQVNYKLIDALHDAEIYVAIETNGTRLIPWNIDWICVSPKAGAPMEQKRGNELKVVWPQPLDLDELSTYDFEHFWLSPMDGPNLAENTQQAIDYCLQHPQWRLNVQTHKVIGVK
jgi:7-carboxy-7-deazaguanine synthase